MHPSNQSVLSVASVVEIIRYFWDENRNFKTCMTQPQQLALMNLGRSSHFLKRPGCSLAHCGTPWHGSHLSHAGEQWRTSAPPPLAPPRAPKLFASLCVHSRFLRTGSNNPSHTLRHARTRHKRTCLPTIHLSHNPSIQPPKALPHGFAQSRTPKNKYNYAQPPHLIHLTQACATRNTREDTRAAIARQKRWPQPLNSAFFGAARVSTLTS